jgi:hypothetical protein
VKAYLGQQRGYGTAEALLKRKHPEKFRGFRNDLSWHGRIYTRAGLGLNVGEPSVHYGVFGMGLFQTIYAAPQVWWPLLATSLEWWLAMLLVLGAAIVSPPLGPLFITAIAMLLTTLGIAYWVAGQASPPPHQRRWWSRLLIAAMHVAQPVERGFARYKTRFQTISIPASLHELRRRWEARAGRLLDGPQIELWSDAGVPRQQLLERLLQLAAERSWFVRVDPGWAEHDVRFYGDRWSKVDVSTVTENHGGGRLLTRVRLRLQATLYQKGLLFLIGYVVSLAWVVERASEWLLVPGLGFLLFKLVSARRLLRRTVVAGLLQSAQDLGMTLVGDPELLQKPEPARAPVSVPAPSEDAVSAPAREAV